MIACCLLNLGDHTCTQSNIKRSGDGDDTKTYWITQTVLTDHLYKKNKGNHDKDSCNHVLCTFLQSDAVHSFRQTEINPCGISSIEQPIAFFGNILFLK